MFQGIVNEEWKKVTKRTVRMGSCHEDREWGLETTVRKLVGRG